MTAMGVKIPHFEVPVCNSFKAKILYDQLCYEVDLNLFSNKSNINNELKTGFSFLMDYNDDRQIVDEDLGWQDEDGIMRLGGSKKEKRKERGVLYRISNTDILSHASIFLNSTGGMFVFTRQFRH